MLNLTNTSWAVRSSALYFFQLEDGQSCLLFDLATADITKEKIKGEHQPLGTTYGKEEFSPEIFCVYWLWGWKKWIPLLFLFRIWMTKSRCYPGHFLKNCTQVGFDCKLRPKHWKHPARFWALQFGCYYKIPTYFLIFIMILGFSVPVKPVKLSGVLVSSNFTCSARLSSHSDKQEDFCLSSFVITVMTRCSITFA